MRDAYRGSRTDTKRQHKRQVGHLVGDMMCGQRLLVNPADDDKRGGEEKRLRERLQADRRTDTQQVAYVAPADHMSAYGLPVLSPVFAAQHHREKAYRHQRTRDQRSPSCALGSHRRKAHMTEDQYPVKENIQQVAKDRDDHRHEGISESLQELLEEAEEEMGQDREHY